MNPRLPSPVRPLSKSRESVDPSFQMMPRRNLPEKGSFPRLFHSVSCGAVQKVTLGKNRREVQYGKARERPSSQQAPHFLLYFALPFLQLTERLKETSIFPTRLIYKELRQIKLWQDLYINNDSLLTSLK